MTGPLVSAPKEADLSKHISRLSSPNVQFTAHVSEDNRYVLLPVMECASKVIGWVVYDSFAGRVIRKPWKTLHSARTWLESLEDTDGAYPPGD